MKDDCKCGPFWFPKWAKRIVSKKFNEACFQHDVDYRNQFDSREASDNRFLNKMLLLSQTKTDVITAYVFFILVRCFGLLSWHKSKIENFYLRK